MPEREDDDELVLPSPDGAEWPLDIVGRGPYSREDGRSGVVTGSQVLRRRMK